MGIKINIPKVAPAPKIVVTVPKIAVAATPAPAKPATPKITVVGKAPSVSDIMSEVATTSFEPTRLMPSSEYQFATQPDGFAPELMQALDENIRQLEAGFPSGDSIKQILTQLMMGMQADAGASAKLLRPQDIGLMVRGLRSATDYKVATKTEAKTRRASKASEKAALASEFEDIFGGAI